MGGAHGPKFFSISVFLFLKNLAKSYVGAPWSDGARSYEES